MKQETEKLWHEIATYIPAELRDLSKQRNKTHSQLIAVISTCNASGGCS